MMLRSKIEKLIDSSDLGSVISATAEVCSLKAERISEHRQDEELSHHWKNVGYALAVVLGKCSSDLLSL